jgi:hypothetical protein
MTINDDNTTTHTNRTHTQSEAPGAGGLYMIHVATIAKQRLQHTDQVGVQQLDSIPHPIGPTSRGEVVPDLQP